MLVQPNFKFSLESVKCKVVDGIHFEFTWKIIPINLFTFIQSSFQKGSRTGNNMAGDQGNESGSAGHCTLCSFHITSFVNIRAKMCNQAKQFHLVPSSLVKNTLCSNKRKRKVDILISGIC